jgi:endonuclease-3
MNAKTLNIIFDDLQYKYGKNINTMLKYNNLTELFVAVFLSPQCTDTQVNKITLKLFKKYKNFEDYAFSNIQDLQESIKEINYYKTKAKNLKKSAEIIINKFNGEIPKNIHDLISLPGVGRKVANVILAEGFNINEGIAIDTHCITVSKRLKLVRKNNAVNIEKYLMRNLDRTKWNQISNLLIKLGKDTCKARNKECFRCILKDICPSSDKRYLYEKHKGKS